MAVLSVLLFACALAASVGALVATVAPRWALIWALLRHGAAADWAPPPPPRRAPRGAVRARAASPAIARRAAA